MTPIVAVRGEAGCSVLWLRRDLRLHDHPALQAAAAAGSVLPLFVVDPALQSGAGPYRVSRLAQSLHAFHASADGHLVVRSGDPRRVVPEVAAQAGARAVHVSAETTPYGRRRDAGVARVLAGAGVEWVASGSPYAVGPGRVRSSAGTPYRVFTAFARAWRAHGWPAPAAVPGRVDWLSGIASEGLPAPSHVVSNLAGEAAARQQWRAFLDQHLEDYDSTRDRPDLDLTSRMSVPLKYGEVHPRTLLADLVHHRVAGSAAVRRFIDELAWREFYADVLWHHPESSWADLNPDLAGLQYDAPDERFEAWTSGRTGFPLVDAGMRQLASQGWMHNRVRMVTASFCVKDLHVWWVHGARHFLAHLIDGDLASNSHGWQWVAGTGTDAAPYFRVFNPVRQGLRFDPDGDYVRRWLPELAHLDGAAAHEPWKRADGYAHGYPERIVDHDEERAEALRRHALARVAGSVAAPTGD